MIEYHEDATPLEYEELQGLLLDHITTRADLDFWEAQNIAEAQIWSQGLKKKNLLSPKFICQAHKKMFGTVWEWAGKYRKTEKNIGIPARRIETEVHTLCEDAKAWVEFEIYPSDEFAARFHHRLVAIHPFSNGNGRHARFMADLILEKLLNAKPFTWGGKNLVRADDIRQAYIQALKAADGHDYSLLMAFVRS